MSLHYLVKHKNAKIAPFKWRVKGFPEFSQKLLDFLNIADVQLIFSLLGYTTQ